MLCVAYLWFGVLVLCLCEGVWGLENPIHGDLGVGVHAGIRLSIVLFKLYIVSINSRKIPKTNHLPTGSESHDALLQFFPTYPRL